MAAVRNVSGMDLEVPELGPFGRTVKADEVIEVPDDRVEAFTCQPGTWAAADTTSSTTAPAAQNQE